MKYVCRAHHSFFVKEADGGNTAPELESPSKKLIKGYY